MIEPVKTWVSWWRSEPLAVGFLGGKTWVSWWQNLGFLVAKGKTDAKRIKCEVVLFVVFQ